MKNHHFAKVSLGCLLCLVMFMTGCISISGCSMRAKYERTVQLSAPLSPGSAFEAQTHNGSIIINGADVADCNMTATIVTRAATDEEARELSEKVKVTLVPSGNRLITKIDKPTRLINKSVSVSFDVEVPNQTDLELITHNGAIVLADIEGKINATTHNGKVTTENINGTTVLKTHNGSVTCREISGDSQLSTHNGGVKAFYSGSASSTTPPGFFFFVDASTHNGSINTDLPITVTGKVSKSKLTGTIGAGEGQLYLETYNGSIRIR